MSKYTWKDIVKINGITYAEEFEITGAVDFLYEVGVYVYQIDEFLESVAEKYGVDVDEVETYMMDGIEFDPSTMPFGAEDCGCYIDGVAEWLL